MSRSRVISPRSAVVAGTRRRLSTGAFALVGTASIAILAGCGGSGVHTQAGPTADSSPTVSAAPSTSPPAPTARERVITAAESQVRKYEQVLDDLSTHSKASLNSLSSVSTSPDLTEEVGSLNRFREANDRIVGHSRVTSIRVERVDLPSSEAPKKLPTAQVSICLYVGKVRAFDHAGHSIVPKSRKPYFLTHLTLLNRNYPNASTWLVSKVTDREVDRCTV